MLTRLSRFTFLLFAPALLFACTDKGELIAPAPASSGGESSSAQSSSGATGSSTSTSGMGTGGMGMGGAAGMGGSGGSGGMGMGGAGGMGMGGAGGMGMGGSGGASTTGNVIFGLTDFDMIDPLTKLEITKRINGAIVETTTYDGQSKPFPPAPLEVAFSDLPDGTMVTLDAAPSNNYGTAPHRASTTVVAGKTLLIRQHLNGSCMLAPGFNYCAAGKVCSDWACVEPFLPPSTLETYSPDWMNYSSCNVPGAGAPIVIVGEGPDQFRTLLDGDTVKLGEGGQGGFHFWLAVRTQNLGRAVTIKAIAKLPELGVETFLNTWDTLLLEETGSGYCESWYQQLQIDYLVPNPPTDLFSKTLVVDVTVQSEQGASASTSRTLKIANSL